MITTTTEAGILTVTIDNPARANSLTAEMLVGLRRIFTEASADVSLRGVLLTSAGGRGFSAGMDTSQFEHSSSTQAMETITLLGRVCEAIKDCDLPVAVAMSGYCIGGALEIAAAADFRIGAASSWYSMPEARIGIPSVLESVNLPRLMGWTKATELMLTAERFSAEAMESCGFLNAIAADAEVEAAARGYLASCAESDRDVIAQQKRLFRT